MSYLFYNNWPYSYTVFPTMEDHTDPADNDYFTGLHQEIENIENTLGLSPEGLFDTVVSRLNDIDARIPTTIFTSLYFMPHDFVLPTLDPATLTIVLGDIFSFNTISFPTGVDKYAYINFLLPYSSNTADKKITFYWYSVGLGDCNVHGYVWIGKANESTGDDIITQHAVDANFAGSFSTNENNDNEIQPRSFSFTLPATPGKDFVSILLKRHGTDEFDTNESPLCILGMLWEDD